MKERLRAYIDALFADAPLTQKAVELKEEILQNIFEKYDDLLAEGKSEEAAYNIVVAGLGDISSLIAALGSRTAYAAPVQPNLPQETPQAKRRSALIVSGAVMLYILSIVPTILIDELFDSDLGVLVMFAMIAAATGLLIYHSMTKKPYRKADDTVVEEFRAWNANQARDKQVLKSLSGALWALILVTYFLVSFTTMAWHITWLIFPIGGALEAVMKAVYDLTRKP